MSNSTLKLHFDQDSFELTSRDGDLLSAFSEVFTDDVLAPASPRASRDCRCIEVDREGCAFRVEMEGSTWSAPSFQHAAYAVMQAMSDSFVAHVSERRCVMHAATAALGGRAVLFSGPSGSGKTSLALAFSEFEGFMGDECSYVDLSTARVIHEAFPFQLKKANVALLSSYGGGPRLDVCEDSVGEASYLPLDALTRCTRAWIPLSAIVFPVYRPKQEPGMAAKADPSTLPELILGSLIGSSAPSKTLADFLAMCALRDIRFYEVAYSDAFAGAKALRKLLRRERAAR